MSVFVGDKILLTTPLLRWYLDHGLKVTNIHKVIEFSPRACFVDFGEKITEARRQGDLHPRYKLIGETMKLIGNSRYVLVKCKITTSLLPYNNECGYMNYTLFKIAVMVKLYLTKRSG